MVQLFTASPLRCSAAGAARRRVAADVGAGEAEHFADVVDEQRARLHVAVVDRAVDGDRNLHL